MADIVFIICALTCLVCAVLLFRAYRETKARLLLWSGLCFLGMFTTNVLLYVDIRILLGIDLSIVRTIPALAGVCCLLYGLIIDTPS
ncbi:MAG TPA: DUF5985 family protein [Capsulimonadaceae bacterium]|nr:DUF5985 family protein [Capsulimonadaceae bacterium]